MIRVPAGTKHWHGAKADSWFSHVAFITPGEDVSNEWLEPVTDEVYGAAAEERRERMTILNETYTLSNGVEIPKLGLGTWFIDDDKAAEAVRARHRDRLPQHRHRPGVRQRARRRRRRAHQRRRPRRAVRVHQARRRDQGLRRGGSPRSTSRWRRSALDYIDLMLIHSPQPWDDFRGGDYAEGNREAWRALEEAYKAGKLRSIGVSNFQQQDLENILEHGDRRPAREPAARPRRQHPRRPHRLLREQEHPRRGVLAHRARRDPEERRGRRRSRRSTA